MPRPRSSAVVLLALLGWAVCACTANDETPEVPWEGDPYEEWVDVKLDKLPGHMQRFINSGYFDQSQEVCKSVMTSAMKEFLDLLESVVPTNDECLPQPVEKKEEPKDQVVMIDGKEFKVINYDDEEKRRKPVDLEWVASRPKDQKSPWCNFQLLNMKEFVSHIIVRFKKTMLEIPGNICSQQTSVVRKIITDAYDKIYVLSENPPYKPQLDFRAVSEIYDSVHEEIKSEKKHADFDFSYFINNFFPMPNDSWRENPEDIVENYMYNMAQYADNVLASIAKQSHLQRLFEENKELLESLPERLHGVLGKAARSCPAEVNFFAERLASRMECQNPWNELAEMIAPVMSVDGEVFGTDNLNIEFGPDDFKRIGPLKSMWDFKVPETVPLHDIIYDTDNTNYNVNGLTYALDKELGRMGEHFSEERKHYKKVIANLNLPEEMQAPVLNSILTAINQSHASTRAFVDILVRIGSQGYLVSALRKIMAEVENLNSSYRLMLHDGQFDKLKNMIADAMAFNKPWSQKEDGQTLDQRIAAAAEHVRTVAANTDLSYHKVAQIHSEFATSIRFIMDTAVDELADVFEIWVKKYQNFLWVYTRATFEHSLVSSFLTKKSTSWRPW